MISSEVYSNNRPNMKSNRPVLSATMSLSNNASKSINRTRPSTKKHSETIMQPAKQSSNKIPTSWVDTGTGTKSISTASTYLPANSRKSVRNPSYTGQQTINLGNNRKKPNKKKQARVKSILNSAIHTESHNRTKMSQLQTHGSKEIQTDRHKNPDLKMIFDRISRVLYDYKQKEISWNQEREHYQQRISLLEYYLDR